VESIELGAGDPILVTLRGDSSAALYYSTILDVDADRLVIERPSQAAGVLDVRIGDELIYSLQSAGEHMRLLVSRVTTVEQGWRVALEMPRGVERRKFFRWETEIAPTRAVLIDQEGREHADLRDVVITNLSGGGLQLRSGPRIDPGSLVRVDFSLEDARPELAAQVRVMSVEPSGADAYFINGRFETVPQEVKSQIIGFIFRRRVSALREEADTRHRRTVD
jgi:c-di-GMP-binding flagellar brake protein YcgR